jgi:uncharacterized protein (DUF362 family)
LIIGLWLSWDLYQAGAHISKSNYHSYKMLSEFNDISSANTKVAIIRSDDSELPDPISVNDENISYDQIEAMVRRAIELAGGLDWVVQPGDTVLLKPNIVDPEPAGSGEVTDVRVIKALIKIIDEIDPGNMEIVVGEGSPRPMDYEMAYQSKFSSAQWEKLWDKAGYQSLLTDSYLAGIHLRLSNLNGSPADNPWQDLVEVEIPGGGQAYAQEGKYFIHKDVINADVYITVPVMKIHTPGITVALKNQIGLAPSTKYGFSKTAGVPQNDYATRLIHGTWTDKEIVDLSQLAQIDYCVVDAIACLEKQKEAQRSGDVITNLVRMNTIIAGADPVAVDHVCTRLMGLNPDDIEHITLAERVGLGTNDPELIEVTGASVEETQQRFIKSPAEEGRYGQSNRIWIVKGPYSIDNISNPIDNVFIENEAELAPTARINGWSDPVYFIEDHINLEDYFNTTDDVVGYTFSYFDAPKEQTAELWIGCDEAMKVFLNGEVVYSFAGIQTFNGYFTDRISVQIKSGENRLLVKTLQKYGNYTFTLNICEPETDPKYDGNRIWGLKFKTESSTTSIPKTETAMPVSNFKLANNYPNPFNGETKIAYELYHPGRVNLSIYNINGQLINCLLEKEQATGKYKISWDGRTKENKFVASGIYLYRLRIGGKQITKKLAYIR